MVSKQRWVSESSGIDLSGGPIELVVGKDPPTTLFVHESLVCASSDFFKQALSQGWKESEQKSITFGDDDIGTFQLYLHWLYRGTLPLKTGGPHPVANAEYIRLVRAYVLGDKLQDGNFQDVILDAIVDKRKTMTSDGGCWCLFGPPIKLLYDNTTQVSKARRLHVDLYVSRAAGAWLRHGFALVDHPKDFLLKIAVDLLDKKSNNPVEKSSLCEYHQHGSDITSCYDYSPNPEISAEKGKQG